MKCVVCNKRKPKRFCPAKHAEICPRCCGEKRGIDIDCPLDCQYLLEGQKVHQQRVTKARIQKEGVKSYVKKADLYVKSPEFFAKVEIAISKHYRANKNLSNKDLILGLDQVKKTLDTMDKGIIFEYIGENEYSNEITKEVLNIANEFINRPAQNRLDLKFIISSIDEFIKEAEYYVENEEGSQSYLRHIARYHPEERKSVNDKSNLIITS